MGLLDRLRPGRDRSPEAAGLAGEAPGPARVTAEADDAEVIRPSTLNPPPGDWSWLPPLQPSLPEMPLIMTQHFERSLPARVPPKQFLAPLGHAVTPSGPGGVVEGLVVIEPLVAPAEQPLPVGPRAAAPAEATEVLPLAVPARSGEDDRWSDVKRLPVAQLMGLASAQGVRASSSPTAEPVVSPEVPPPSPLLFAAAPDGLPVAHLPAAPLPEELRDLYASPVAADPEPASAPPGEPETGPLLGDRPAVSEAPAAAGPVSVPDAPPAAPPGELPLASPPMPGSGRPVGGSEVTGARQVRGEPATEAGLPEAMALSRPGDRAGEPPAEALTPGPVPTPPQTAAADTDAPDAVAPLLGRSAPVTPLEDSPLVGRELGGGHALRPDVDLPLAAPPVAPTAPERSEVTADAAGEGTAPVLGGADPLAPAGTPLVPAVGETPAAGTATGDSRPDGPLPLPAPPERPAPRAGLGAPLAGLPPTARSYDVTSLSRAEQLQVSRALLQSRMATQPYPMALRPGPAQSTTGPLAGRPQAPAGPGPSPESLPVARARPLGPPQLGVLPDDLPDGDGPTAPLLGDVEPLLAQPAPGPSPSPVPLEGVAVRAEIGRIHGVDLSRVPVERGPAAAAEAGRLGARAFASERGVVIPARVGTLEAGEGAALLAHELTHVAQRSRLGTVPDESSVPGRVLEAEARQTEMIYSRGGQPSSVSAAPDRSGAAPAGQTPGLPLAPVAPASHAPADAEAIALSVLERLSTATPASVPVTEVYTAAGPVPSPTPSAPAMSAPVQRAADPVVPLPIPEASTESLAPKPLPRPSDEDLSNLSRWLYPLIRYRLKRDLREERERAGLLTDHYRKW